MDASFPARSSPPPQAPWATGLFEFGAAARGQLLGESAAMRAVLEQVRRVAPTEASVLLTGESGVGKELVAEAIHRASPRAAAPMIAINCGSIPGSLLEAELFGYEKGSFTGASRAHAGVFERGDGGTLLLDEITEMPIEKQTRLLRVLETGRFYRVGGTQEITTDIRVIAATNQSMDAALRERHLREDVMYRLAVFPLHIPPLRDRGEDVVLLARHFLERLNLAQGSDKQLSPDSLLTLRQYDWPGNVRELKNAVERAFILADDTLQLAPNLIPRRGQEPPGIADPDHAIQVPVGSRLDQAERSLIEATLEYFEGNKRRAAEVLGCSLKTLYNKLNAYARVSLSG